MLNVSGITKSFSGVKIVDDIGFTAEKGQILGVLGPNGAGKTTIIRCIMGIILPDEGYVEINGRSYREIPRNLIGYLPEERGLYRDVKVLDIILYFANLKRFPHQKAKENAKLYLEKFGISEKMYDKVETLSKGMAQKVQFIISIIHEPELLILDEPFFGLDPVSQNEFLSEIKAIADSGKTILLSSHQMNLVEELCDRIFLINKGKKIIYGELDSIKKEFANFKCTLRGNFDQETLGKLILADRVIFDKNKATIHLKKGAKPVDFLRNFPELIKISELHLDRISLHDIFVNIVKGDRDEK